MDLTFFAQIRAAISSLTQHPLWVGLGIGAGFLLFSVSIALLPVFVFFIPEDYFVPSGERPQVSHKKGWWVARIVLHILKNLLGIFLILMGLIMFFTPGQGLLTVFLGFLFLNFPGKRRLELALIRRPSIYRAINKMREFRGKPPLRLP